MGVSVKLRFEVFKRDSFKCQYCGRSAPDVTLEADHIEPESLGGQTTLLNLITACFECNRGKRNIRLSDDSALSKQRSQLESIQARREQVEMMIRWQRELIDFDCDLLAEFEALWDIAVERLHELDQPQRLAIKKALKQFGFAAVMDSMHIAISQYNDLSYAADKIYGISLNRSREPQDQEESQTFTYCRSVLINRFGAPFFESARTILTKGVGSRVPLDMLRTAALTCEDTDNFIHLLEMYLGYAYKLAQEELEQQQNCSTSGGAACQ